MTFAAQHHALSADEFALACIPAHVEYLPGRHVLVTHPHGPGHENVRLTIARLAAKGFHALDLAAVRDVRASVRANLRVPRSPVPDVATPHDVGGLSRAGGEHAPGGAP
jgi:hypothetical protein